MNLTGKLSLYISISKKISHIEILSFGKIILNNPIDIHEVNIDNILVLHKYLTGKKKVFKHFIRYVNPSDIFLIFGYEIILNYIAYKYSI